MKTAAEAAAAAAALGCDALYVLNPDFLIECCTQVAREVGGFIAGMATEAGLRHPVELEPLFMLLEKLLMVQVSDDVSCVSHDEPRVSHDELRVSGGESWW